MPGGRKLDIGNPTKRNDGWETCDIRPGADHVCSATNVSSLGNFDALECSMVLEHLRPWEILKALRDWYKALNEGGVVDISVPDLEDIVKLMDSNEWEAVRRLFGGSTIEGGPDDCPEQEHRWAFSRFSLWWYLQNVGFRDIERIDSPAGILHMRAYK
jgi:predicted SAM-dependent methyltransferase